MTNTRPRDEKDWRGRVEFGLTHKPQRRHVRKSVPRPHDPMVGKPPPSANADIAEMEHKSKMATAQEREKASPLKHFIVLLFALSVLVLLLLSPLSLSLSLSPPSPCLPALTALP